MQVVLALVHCRTLSPHNHQTEHLTALGELLAEDAEHEKGLRLGVGGEIQVWDSEEKAVGGEILALEVRG